MADLGFDSLQVLELVGELEDHFNIAVPLNGLTHIRTVAQIAAEAGRERDRPGWNYAKWKALLDRAAEASNGNPHLTEFMANYMSEWDDS